MASISPWKEYWPNWRSNWQPTVLKFYRLWNQISLCGHIHVNYPLPDDKAFDWPKLKQIANDILTLSWFLRDCNTRLLKTPWEEEKLLYPFEEVSAIFVKFVIVVYKLFQFGQALDLSFGKGLKCISNEKKKRCHI